MAGVFPQHQNGRFGADLDPVAHRTALVSARAVGQTLASAFPVRSRVIRDALASADLPWPGGGLLWVPGS